MNKLEKKLIQNKNTIIVLVNNLEIRNINLL